MKLNDEELEQVSGGAIFNASGISGSDPGNPWEVLDGNGNVKGRYPTREMAIYNAGKMNVDFFEVSWDQVQAMRR